MNRNKNREALDAAKSHLLDYLCQHGHTPNRNNMLHCIRPQYHHHGDKNPSMQFNSDTHTVFCHGCGFSGDLVDVVAEIEGLQPKSKEAIERAIEFADTKHLAHNTPRGNRKNTSAANERNMKGYSLFIHTCSQHFDDEPCVAFRRQRGFLENDDNTLKHFRVGFDPSKNTVVIPHDLNDSYYTARKINAEKNDRFKNNPRGKVIPFNVEALTKKPIVVVCEGAIDALSLLCLGFPAVALGGVQHHNKLLDVLTRTDTLPHLIIAFDNDQAGNDSADKLAELIHTRFNGAHVKKITLQHAHDLNDLFIDNRSELTKIMNEAFNELNTLPTIDTKKAMSLAKKSTSTSHGNDDARLDTTDAAIAEQVLQYANGRLIYNCDLAEYMRYHEPRWQALNKDAELRSLLRDYRKSLEGSNQKGAEDVCGCLTSEKKIPKVIAYMRSFNEIYTPQEKFDAHEMMLNCLNGTVDLTTGELLPHNPAFLWSKCANFTFEPNARSDVWEHFIETTISNVDTRTFLQTFLGYCLTGSCREEKALFVHGTGSNGKGTLFNTLIYLMGEFATPFKIDAVLAGMRSDAQAATPEFNKLEKARLAIAEEIPAGRKLDVAQFKLLTGGDQIPVRRLYHEATYIDPSHKLIFSGNALPQLADNNNVGMQRRLLVVRFENSFLGNNADPNLKQKLMQADVLSAIANWLLEGCLRWQKEGLKIPADVSKQRDQYLADNDFVVDFINDNCNEKPDAKTFRKELIGRARHEGDRRFSQMNDREIVDALKLAFKKLGWNVEYKVSTGNKCVFHGVELQQNEHLFDPDNV